MTDASAISVRHIRKAFADVQAVHGVSLDILPGEYVALLGPNGAGNCSGIFFSYHNFPEWLVGVIRYLPLTIIADHMRGICIEGAGFLDVLSSLGILIGSGLLYFLIGKRYYKWY